MKNRPCASILFVIFLFSSCNKDKEKEISLHDENLNAEYIINITLPPDFEKHKSYPMYMMTDGIWRISDHAEIKSMMENGEIESIILVSIGYNAKVSMDEIETRRFAEFVQKKELFMNFITEKLIPYLDELYTIDYRRSALMGHSLGGLFVYYALFSHDMYAHDPFRYYVISSPSLIFTHNKMYWKSGDIIDEYFERNELLEKEIYLSAGNQEGYFEMLADINTFMRAMEEYGVTTLDYEIFNGDHVSFVKPMLRKSLIKFYEKKF